jgi:hypothetical protein
LVLAAASPSSASNSDGVGGLVEAVDTAQARLGVGADTVAFDRDGSSKGSHGEVAVHGSGLHVDSAVVDPTRGDALGFDLPDELRDGVRGRTADGRVVVEAGADEVGAVVEALDGGVRIQTILTSRGAASRYEYTFHGDVTPVIRADGGADLVVPGAAGASVTIVGSVDAPWAVDADGRDVPSWYEVQGSILIQVVEHESGSYDYPIVADPKVTTGLHYVLPVYYVHYTKSETNSMRALLNHGGSNLPALFCSYIPNTTAKVVCGAIFLLVKADIQSEANKAVRDGRCLALRLPATAGAINMVSYDAYTRKC